VYARQNNSQNGPIVAMPKYWILEIRIFVESDSAAASRALVAAHKVAARMSAVNRSAPGVCLRGTVSETATTINAVTRLSAETTNKLAHSTPEF
jgi:hypothetical protein